MQVGAAGIAAALQGLAGHFESYALREVGDGVEELHLLVLHEKADHGAVRAAAEAMIELLVGTYPEGGGLFVVERAACLEFAPGFLERHACADDFDDVGARDDFVDERLWNAAGHGPRAVSRLSGL